jgi:uncharacterized membrane protein
MEGCLGIILGLVAAGCLWGFLAFIGIPFWLSFFIAVGCWIYFVGWIAGQIGGYSADIKASEQKMRDIQNRKK